MQGYSKAKYVQTLPAAIARQSNQGVGDVSDKERYGEKLFTKSTGEIDA